MFCNITHIGSGLTNEQSNAGNGPAFAIAEDEYTPLYICYHKKISIFTP